MDIDDKELFSSAMTDDPIPEVAEQPAEAPAQETPQQEERQRDDHGRFVSPKGEAEPEQPQAGQQEENPAERSASHIPPWRLREERERVEALERRYNDERMQWQRQIEMLQRQVPKPEPQPAPDLFENPQGAIEYGAKQLLSPIEQRLQAQEARLQAQLEFVSRRDAFQQYGEPTVRSAYEWLANGVRSQDPDVVHAYNRAMQSEHPYDAAVQAFKRAQVMQQISQIGDLDKWVMQRAQELASGERAGQQQATNSRQSSRTPQGSTIKLPPTMSRIPASQIDGDDDSDTSDAALFRHAMR